MKVWELFEGRETWDKTIKWSSTENGGYEAIFTDAYDDQYETKIVKFTLPKDQS